MRTRRNINNSTKCQQNQNAKVTRTKGSTRLLLQITKNLEKLYLFSLIFSNKDGKTAVHTKQDLFMTLQKSKILGTQRLWISIIWQGVQYYQRSAKQTHFSKYGNTTIDEIKASNVSELSL